MFHSGIQIAFAVSEGKAHSYCSVNPLFYLPQIGPLLPYLSPIFPEEQNRLIQSCHSCLMMLLILLIRFEILPISTSTVNLFRLQIAVVSSNSLLVLILWQMLSSLQLLCWLTNLPRLPTVMLCIPHPLLGGLLDLVVRLLVEMLPIWHLFFWALPMQIQTQTWTPLDLQN